MEAGISIAFSKLLGLPADAIEHCNCNAAANCLNMSVCAASTCKSSFTIAAWNPTGHAVSDIARVPVSGPHWTITDASGKSLPSQVYAPGRPHHTTCPPPPCVPL